MLFLNKLISGGHIHVPCNEAKNNPLTMCDTCLPFGAHKSPAIFNHITQAVARSLCQTGHHVVVYLDY